jgi:hypothetical protein
VMGYGQDGLGSIPSRGKFLLLSIMSRPTLAHTDSMGTRGSLGVQRHVCEADYSPPSSAEVKNGGAIPSPPTHIHGMVLK